MLYLMDHPDEAARLVAKVDPTTWVDQYVTAHLRPSSRVLEVGCGPGHLLGALPSDVIGVGVDLSHQRLAFASPGRAVSVQGDAVQLPFAPRRFDVSYSRFLLQYLGRRHDAVAEMARVTKRGGTVLLQDLDGQMVWHDGEEEELRAELDAMVPMFARLGFDPFVGRKLRRLARDAGLIDVTVSIEPYHVIAGPIDPVARAQWATKLRIATPLFERVLESPARASRFVDRFMAHLDSPDTLTYSNVFTVRGHVP